MAVALLVVLSGAASATPPCGPFSYSVAYAGSFCNATLLSPSVSFPLVNIWWANWWNGTVNYTTGTGFERASDHVDQVATSEERITVQDRDGDLNLSADDVLEVWSPGACGGNLALYLGANATTLGGAQTLQLQDGYQWICGASPPDYLGLGLLIAAVVALVVVPIGLVILRRRTLRP